MARECQTFLREQERVIIGMKETFNRKKMAMKTRTTPSPMMKRVLYIDTQFLRTSSTIMPIKQKIGRKLGGTSDGYGDAVRHCYWCALNQISAGYNSPLAKEFGDAHENIPNNEAKTMDLHNNSVGYYLGNQAIINGWDENDLLKHVINAADNGKLKIGL